MEKGAEVYLLIKQKKFAVHSLIIMSESNTGEICFFCGTNFTLKMFVI